MIFQHAIDKVLSGEKTLTSRIVKPEHSIGRIAYGTPMEFMPNNAGWGDIVAVRQNGRDVYALNKTYAVQLGRGKPAAARIRLLSIRRYDVRNITDDEARREGFANKYCFLDTWLVMHDKTQRQRLSETEYDPLLPNHCPLWLYARPAARYAAWQLGFGLVKS